VEVASLGNIYLPLVEGQGPMQAMRRASSSKQQGVEAAALAKLLGPRTLGRPKCVCAYALPGKD